MGVVELRRIALFILTASVTLCLCCGCNTFFVMSNDPQTTTSATNSSTSTTGDTSKTTTTTKRTVSTTATTSTTTTSSTSTTTKRTTQTTTTTTRTTGTTTTQRAPHLSEKNLLSVPIIHQFPDFPSGCESVSAVMALQYYNEKISVSRFVNKHLSKNSHYYYKNGVYHGPDPYQHFIGDPTTTHSYGCMAPVIEKALISYFGSNDRVKNTTGQSLSELCSTYIDQGMPVLVWVTIGMIETTPGASWHLEDGTKFTWPNNEHCMVLVGYSKTHYFFNDPYRGTVKSYPHWLCNARYKDLGMQSIAITK